MKAWRELTDEFMADLEHGSLKPVLERVRSDHTLMLALRGDYVNVYYRGGSLMKVTTSNTSSTASYKAFFNAEYDKSRQKLPELREQIDNREDAEAWVSAFPALKEIMDLYFSKRQKAEREFQQLVARENNNSPVSAETEYFITDIEVAESGMGARFDMLGVYWPAKDRQSGSTCRPVLIEMKYGSNSLSGQAGLMKHLEDMELLINDKEKLGQLMSMASSQFRQLDRLGLFKYNRSSSLTEISVCGKPQVVFLLANLNPRGGMLPDVLCDQRLDAVSSSFDLRFFVANFAGYGMHSDCMLTLPEFRERIAT